MRPTRWRIHKRSGFWYIFTPESRCIGITTNLNTAGTTAHALASLSARRAR